jgi:hypothetical protein
MGELIEGLMEFGPEASEFIAKVEEITASLKNLAEIVDVFFNTTAVEKMFQGVQGQIKSIGPALSAAFKQGKLEELLGDTFEAAVERLGNLLFDPNFWTGLAYMVGGILDIAAVGILKIILNIGIVLKTVLDKTFQDIYREMGKVPGLGKALGLSNYKAESFSQIYQENRNANAPGNEFINAMIEALQTSMVHDGARMLGKALDDSKTGSAQAQFNSLFQSMLSASPKTVAAKPVSPLDDLHPHETPTPRHLPLSKEFEKTDDSEFRLHKPEFTALEKMGFIMSGSKAHNPYDQQKIDLLQQIVRNTSIQRVGLGWGAYDSNHTIRDSLLETNAL